MKKIIISAFAILLIALKDEKNRLSDNQETLLSDVEYYRTSDSDIITNANGDWTTGFSARSGFVYDCLYYDGRYYLTNSQ